MPLVDSLLSAIVRADGDALVMHVGERPYVVVGTHTINISTHGLNLGAMTGMLGQLLPADAMTALEEFGAVEHRLQQMGDDRFTVVAARGGDDIWIEIRRRREAPAEAASGRAGEPVAAAPVSPPQAPPPVAVPEPVAGAEPEPVAVAEPQPVAVAEPEPVAVAEPEPVVVAAEPEPVVVAAEPEPVVAAAEPEPVVVAAEPEPVVIAAESEPVVVAAQPEPVVIAAAPEPVVVAEPEPVAVALPEPVVVQAPAPVAEPKPEPEPEPVPVQAIVVSEPEAVIHTTIELIESDDVDEPVELIESASAESDDLLRDEPVELLRDERVEPAEPGVVLPLTRTVRIEVPPKSAPISRISNVERLLRVAAARGASSLFLASDSRPYMRVEGDMRLLEPEPVMTKAEVEGAILEIAPGGGDQAGKNAATEWITEFAELGRIRCTTFTDHRGRGMHLSLIATRAATAEQLGLSPEVQALATEPQGLVLIAGPRGNGKSTLISALVDLVNRQRAEFIVTLERQIRLVHDNHAAVVSQREIRGGADDAVAAARAALRENPGVLAVDDLASPHMVPLLLNAASEGLLVFVSMSAASSTEAVQRFIEMAAPGVRTAVQNAMAESFRGAVAQVLLKKTGGGLVPAREILLATSAVCRLLADGQVAQLPVALESGRKHGMVSFTDALVGFVRSNAVDAREAFRKAPDRARLLAALKREGLDTTAVERLA